MHSPRLNSTRRLFEIRGYDDRGRKEVARKLALHIRKNPNVIALVGHATSGTTRAAARLYEQAGIPILMPIATSPLAAFPPNSKIVEENRLRNYFRLPPSDDRVQAPAIAIFAIETLKTKKCILLKDISADAADYSTPLVQSLERLIPDCRILQAPFSVNIAEPSFANLAIAIAADSPDTVIFCGYGTTAHRLFYTLRMHYERSGDTERPRFILTDGCKIDDIDTSGFETYVTFPAPDIRATPPDRDVDSAVDDLTLLKKHISPSVDLSYHIFGYDALMLIGSSLEDLPEEEISRRSLLETLRKTSRSFYGVVSEYDFVQGESVRAGYGVYRATPEPTAESRFVFHSYIDYNQIRHFLAKRE